MLLILPGLLAGFIDSIAGGGGLITLPALMLALGPGAGAIGTNKIAGTLAALVALLVYLRGGHGDWKRSVAFAAFTGAGSLAGSRVSPHLPPEAFRWFLAITCPLILWVVWRKDLWIGRDQPGADAKDGRIGSAVALAGLGCGFYDGLWGPGGGTFMFLSLLFAGKLPLLIALSASKLANTASAFLSLLSYGQQGYIRWPEGGWIGLGTGVGAFLGARFASRARATAVRPALVFVVSLLVFRLLLQ